jgi:hypothetical protein
LPPLGTNKKGVVTYKKDFVFKRKKFPQSCHISKGKKKKKKRKKKVEMTIFRPEVLCISPI